MLEAGASDEPKAPVLHAGVLVVEKEDDWREHFIAFLVHQRAPEDKTCDRTAQIYSVLSHKPLYLALMR